MYLYRTLAQLDNTVQKKNIFLMGVSPLWPLYDWDT